MDLELARERMVAEQLRSRGINDAAVLEAMRMVERHRFISPELVEHAYDDGRCRSAPSRPSRNPYIVAEMTQIAELKGNEKVLEIGTGCGYQTAILARLAREVYSIECIAELAAPGDHDPARAGIYQLLFQGRRRFAGMGRGRALRRDHSDGGDAGDSAAAAGTISPPAAA